MLTQQIDTLLLKTDDLDIKRVLIATTTLFDAVKHGSEDHMDWLEQAIIAHFTDSPMPEYKK